MKFNFKGEQQNQLVGQCSGGERNRVHLAKMLKQAPNVLFLDEPTNDLDVEVLRNLENALQDFIGMLLHCCIYLLHQGVPLMRR